ncbi:type II secretion system major pseudopilin GspG [Klebsiella aerogenes]|uniref:type II secretion system major pseudopilin GspG n=1 Tax=Klebsiella aerogenes TaxID=548 RepID=UPI0007B3CD64|nr:type II secretion system major pseudopilin GspG [Klebsiella aerogenes]EKZ5855724.1 type II secretion system major pseudopilin GspG [Klebsiella aerogenes]EKZ6548485.1 type II secretion system major pseudopilin GspG [Klebsiella aerogenes]EKZ6676762.1 type II secretion system major pseudopilin GspG [Klebsiella aerogenes]KZR11297.1 type II secretion system protein GspG [Klebsiella aerogenes]
MRNDDGFTLLEMMVVVMIIGLLAGLVVPNLLSNKDKADKQKAIADIVVLENAVDMFELDNNVLPTNEDGLNALIHEPESLRDVGTWQHPYIKRLPLDPWHHPYHYRLPGKESEFDIYSLGADGQEGGEGTNADLGSWNVQ